jgi:hypothetical protein
MQMRDYIKIIVAVAIFSVGVSEFSTATSSLAVGDEFVGPFASWINVKIAYGATGDGRHDDTAALQQALNDLGASGHSHVLWIPKGKYKVSSQLTLYRRQNVSIIGEDPVNTIIEWAGEEALFNPYSVSNSMLLIKNVNHSRFDRLTFEGGRSSIVLIDQTWDGHGNYFDTGNQYADDNFQNASIGIRGGALGGGFAETSILRDHFTNLKIAGLITMNFNALDLWVHYSVFDHNGTGVANYIPNSDGTTFISGAGNFHVYNSIFRYSSIGDIVIGNTGSFSVRSNYSIGSFRFITVVGSANAALVSMQGNTVLDTVDPAAIKLDDQGPFILYDNVIRSLPSAMCSSAISVGFGGASIAADAVLVGNTFNNPCPPHFAADVATTSFDNVVVSTSAINPTEPALPITEPNLHRPNIDVPVGANTAQIQEAINTAVSQFNGRRPVVHLPEGTSRITSPLVVPPDADVQLVGDGGFTTLLQWSGTGRGPALQIRGPSHVTLREIGIDGAQTVDAIDADNTDQPGSRVFMFGGVLSDGKNSNLFADGLDHTAFDAEDIAYIGMRGGVDIRVVGGPLAAAGNPQEGKVAIYSAGSGGDQSYTSNIDVSNGGRLLSRDSWFDGEPAASAGLPYLHITHGTVTLDSDHIWINQTEKSQTRATLDISNLIGKVTVLNTDIGGSVVISGNGSKAQVAGIGLVRNQPSARSDTYFYNDASPFATTLLLDSRRWTGKLGGATIQIPNQGTIDNGFVRSMMEQARAEQIPVLTSIANGVTDVRLYRVFLRSGINNIHLLGSPLNNHD